MAMMKRKRECLLILIVFSFLMPFGNQALGLTVNYQYDDLYRLTRVERSDGIVTEYQYDGAGNRLARVIKVIITGDLNGDSAVTLADVLMALQIISGITPRQTVSLNATVNGKVGLPEVIYILEKTAGVRGN
jgi:YD repeat-containing protein